MKKKYFIFPKLFLLEHQLQREFFFRKIEVEKFNKEFYRYQIEGGWNADGKGPSIWDTLTHDHPELVADHMTADVGPDSYHFFQKDIEALKKVGVSCRVK